MGRRRKSVQEFPFEPKQGRAGASLNENAEVKSRSRVFGGCCEAEIPVERRPMLAWRIFGLSSMTFLPQEDVVHRRFHVGRNQSGQLTNALCRRHIVPIQKTLRALGEPVVFNVGMAHAISASLSKCGEAGDAPKDDAVRPGRGLGYVVGMIVDSLSPAGTRQSEVSIHSLR